MLAPLVIALIGTLLVPAPALQQTFNLDEEGFIRNWLVLAPIPMEGDSGAVEMDTDLLMGEAKVRPRAGDKQKIVDLELPWQPHQTAGYFIDFRQSFGQTQGEYVVGYALAYVIAEQDMNVTMLLSTNDQGKAWLNGKEIFKFAEARGLQRDSDRVDVQLNKGQNVVMLKILNEVNDWQGCLRFVQNDVPVKNLKISLTPQ
jgi:hypothetical protein